MSDARGVDVETDRDIAVVDAEQLVEHGGVVAVFGLFTLVKTPPTSVNPKLLSIPTPMLVLDQKPTVVPMLLRPVTCVCTEPGKFSLVKLAWPYGGTTV